MVTNVQGAKKIELLDAEARENLKVKLLVLNDQDMIGGEVNDAFFDLESQNQAYF